MRLGSGHPAQSRGLGIIGKAQAWLSHSPGGTSFPGPPQAWPFWASSSRGAAEVSPADAPAVMTCRTCVTACVRKTLVGSGSSHRAERSRASLGSACREGAGMSWRRGGPSPEPICIIYKPLRGASHPDTQHAWCFLATGVEHWRSRRAPHGRSAAMHRRCRPALARLLRAASRRHRRGAPAGQGDNGTKEGFFKHSIQAMPGPLQSKQVSPQPWKRLSGSAQWKEPVGSWQPLGSERLPNSGRCARDRDKQKKPGSIGVTVPESTKHLRRGCPTRRALFRAPARGVAKTHKHLSADAKMSFFPFSSQRILENNMSERLRDQMRAECVPTCTFFIKLHILNSVS